MKKINYKTKYVKEFLKSIEDLEIILTMNGDSIEIEAENRFIITTVLHRMEDSGSPLTYQIEDQGKTMVLFDPRI